MARAIADGEVTAGSGPAASFQVAAGKAPFAVNSNVKVTHLNADLLDGQDASAFLLKTDQRIFAYGQIRADASIRSSSPNVVSVDHLATGFYCVNFSNTPGSFEELEGAVVGLAGSDKSALFARVTNGQGANHNCPSQQQLEIQIVNASGVPTDGRFSFHVP